MSVTFHVYDAVDRIPLDQETWDRIVAQSDVAGVFLRRHWILEWWKWLSRDKTLFFVTANEGNDVIAFAPLMIDASRTLRFVGDMSSDYLGFAIPRDKPGLIDDFFAFLSAERDAWRVMHLRNIPRDSALGTRMPTAAHRAKLFAWRNYTVNAPYLRIAGNTDAVRSIVDKYSLRRAERQLAALGEVRFHVLTDIREAANLWEQFAEQHIARCEVAGRQSPFRDPNYAKFLWSLFEASSADAPTHFSVVLVSGEPAAFHFGFVSENKLLWYKPSFDPAIRKGSPGLVLIRALLQNALDDQFDELDFTIGEEAFKDRFADGRRLVDTFRIHQTRMNASAEAAYWGLRRRAKSLLALARRRFS